MFGFLRRRTPPAPAPAPTGQRPEWKLWNALHQIQASYEAAIKRDDLWNLADFKDADATLLPEKRERIRAHARYEYMNNALVARIVDVWVGDVAGEYGPGLKMATGSAEVDRFVERVWFDWWTASHQARKLRTAVKAEATDGEAVGILISNARIARRQPISLDVVGVECDRLADPNYSGSNRYNYVDGVHLDEFTREPVAYDLLRAHPGSEYLDRFAEQFEADTFPAEQVLHAFRQLRPEQHRGVCRYAPVLPVAGYHRKGLEATVNRYALHAAYAFMIKSMAPPDDGSEETTAESSWWQEFKLPNRSGAGMFLPEGYDISQLRPDGSAGELDKFHAILGGLVAGCFTMPIGKALGNYGAAGYPGIRGDLAPYHCAIASDRLQVWEPLWIDPLLEAFLEELRLLTAFQELLARTTDPIDLRRHDWTWPGRELVVDPSREETARRHKFQMGLTDRERESPEIDLDQADARAAKFWGIEDVGQYRRILAHATLGVPVSPTPPLPGNSPGGEFGDLGRRQWQNNRKAIRDVLQEVIDGQTSEPVALELLQSLGLTRERALVLLEDARDSSIDDPELADAQPPAA